MKVYEEVSLLEWKKKNSKNKTSYYLDSKYCTNTTNHSKYFSQLEVLWSSNIHIAKLVSTKTLQNI